MSKDINFYKKVLEYPRYLQLTILALDESINPLTASDVSLKTKVSRAVSSMYLNELVLLKIVEKSRIGRRVYFKLYISKFLA